MQKLSMSEMMGDLYKIKIKPFKYWECIEVMLYVNGTNVRNESDIELWPGIVSHPSQNFKPLTNWECQNISS